MLTVKESPHRVAVAFAVGVFLGMSPLLGIHTLLGLAAAWLFRLNRFVTLVGVFVTNPWTIVPIYSFSTWVGLKLLGADLMMPDVDWGQMTIKIFLEEFRHLILPFCAGTTFVGTLSAVASYFIIYRMVKLSHVQDSAHQPRLP